MNSPDIHRYPFEDISWFVQSHNFESAFYVKIKLQVQSSWFHFAFPVAKVKKPSKRPDNQKKVRVKKEKEGKDRKEKELKEKKAQRSEEKSRARWVHQGEPKTTVCKPH